MGSTYLSSYNTYSNTFPSYYWIGVLIMCIIFGAICQSIGTNKNQKGCFWLGFFLGFIGLIITLCLPKKNDKFNSSKDKYESLEKLEELKKNEIITEKEYNDERKKILK